MLTAMSQPRSVRSRWYRPPARPLSKIPEVRLWPVGIALGAATAVAVMAVLALCGLGLYLMGVEGIKPAPELTPATAFDLLKLAFAVVAGLGAVVGLVVAYRRQRVLEDETRRAEAAHRRAEAAASREITRLFTERFESASDKLGSEHAAVRLAGVHALAHLADDAPDRGLRQMVIDVLCAYVRMPYARGPGRSAAQDRFEDNTGAVRAEQLAFESMREVRHTVLRIIGDRLRQNTLWRGHSFDFTGAVFDGGYLAGAHFTGGRVSFAYAEFINGPVVFDYAHFTHGTVAFNHARFTGATVSFANARFAGSTVEFRGADFASGRVSFDGAEVFDGGLDFQHARFAGCQVRFDEAAFGFPKKERFPCYARVSFETAHFEGSQVSFAGARFSGTEDVVIEVTDGDEPTRELVADGCEVAFTGANFTGGRVSFDATTVGGNPASGVCPDDLVEVAAAHPDVFSLPESWRPDPLTSPEDH